MANGLIHIYAGDGRGKSPAALGRAVQAAMDGKRVVMIQFLKGKGHEECDILRRMEPEIKLFCFEKSESKRASSVFSSSAGFKSIKSVSSSIL